MTDEQTQIIASLALKMSALGIKAQFVKTEPGPIITGYYFKPSPATPLAKIDKHEEDFALACGRDTVTIQRIKGDVIFFVPNEKREIIDFKDCLYKLVHICQRHSLSEKDKQHGRAYGMNTPEIPIILGVDHIGHERLLDLAEQPHILMAGSTGAGKSTFEQAIICSLVTIMEPDELNLYLIDTKKLDLPLFKDLPHVLDVGDTIEKARFIFEDLLNLTRKRYDLYQTEKVRNTAEYRRKTNNRIPYRVLIIDELADLLSLDKDYCDVFDDCKPIKKILQELSQISRAAGTHIIAATQRPSVKIIDGDTKNNFPTRIGLKVPTRFDSMTILGEPGAETLLGKGDMFIKRVDSSVLERYHGPFVRLEDIENIVKNLEYVKMSLEMMRG